MFTQVYAVLAPAVIEAQARTVQLMEGETPASSSFDIGDLISSMANSVTSNIGVVMGAVAGIIATVVGINFAIRMFKKHAKG